MGEVKLIGHRGSPFSCRVEVALKLKGVAYEFIEEDLSTKSRSPLILQYNPDNKKIPVLIHNGKPIVESVVILEYIDDTWKSNPIFPEDPYEKAMARLLIKSLEEKCLPALAKTVWSMGDQYEKDKAEAFEAIKALENKLKLKGKKYFGGDGIGAVDIVGNFLAFWFIAIQEAIGLDVFTKDNLPRLWEWAEDVVNCSAVKGNLPPKDQLIANFPPAYFGEDVVRLFKSRLLSSSS